MKITDIIAQYLLSKEGQQERNQLAEWHDDTSKNIEIVKELDSVWEATEDFSDYETFDTNAAWSALDSKISEEPKQPLISTKLLAAACVVLLAGLVTWNLIDNHNTSGDKALPNHTTDDSSMSFALEDESRIWLNSNSEFVQVSDFTETRSVSLEGHGYFEIAKDKKRPFTIDTDMGTIKVLGTAFDLNCDPNTFDLKVTEGKVAFTNKKRTYEISANQRLVMDNGVYVMIDWYDHHEADWRFENLSFDNTPLSEVLTTLSTTFQVTFDNSDNLDLTNCLINTKFNDESITDILSELEIIVNLKVKKLSDTTYEISSLKCQ